MTSFFIHFFHQFLLLHLTSENIIVLIHPFFPFQSKIFHSIVLLNKLGFYLQFLGLIVIKIILYLKSHALFVSGQYILSTTTIAPLVIKFNQKMFLSLNTELEKNTKCHKNQSFLHLKFLLMITQFFLRSPRKIS